MQALLPACNGVSEGGTAEVLQAGVWELSLFWHHARAQTYAVRRVPDVERNGFCFSDGVGRISFDLCEAVARWGPPLCCSSLKALCFALVLMALQACCVAPLRRQQRAC